jgi:O-acetyl-ADP-ribose deacetylase (regulator of RNase III)
MIKNVKGNLLDSNCDYICHQVNCRGRMASGIAKQIRERFPEVYDHYRTRYEDVVNLGIDPDKMVGSTDIVKLENDIRHVINIYSQRSYGYDGGRYTSYKAFRYALECLKKEIPTSCTFGFPKYIGCGLGGGDWNVVSKIIEDVLGDSHKVYIFEYEPSKEE